MADYGIGRTGGSLRDALNELYPMTGLGEYGAMFPPPTGADQPTAAVPLPQPRPQMPAQIPPGALAPSSGIPPGALRPPGLQGGLPPQAQLALQGAPGLGGQLQGNFGARLPINPNTAITAGGRFAPGGDYAMQLGLNRQF